MSVIKKEKSRITVGLFLDWAIESYQKSIFNGVNSYLKENNVNLLCFAGGALDSSHQYEKTRNLLYDLANKNNLDGIIVLSGTIANYIGSESMNKFCAKYKPIPLVSIAMQLKDFPSVLANNEEGMSLMMAHLIEVHGYRNIAFVRGPVNNTEAEDRYRAYLSSLKKYKIAFKKELIVDGRFIIESGVEAVRILLDERKVKVDAIFAANDSMALGVVDALGKRKAVQDKKIAVVGYDDIEMGEISILPLTTIRQPIYEQGRKAAEMVLDLINKKKIKKRVKLSNKLVVRKSCGCLSDNEKSVVCTEHGVKSYSYKKNELLAQRDIILDNVFSRSDKKNATLKNSYKSVIDIILKSLYTDIRDNDFGLFLNRWKDFLAHTISKELDLSILQSILSEMRKCILPYLADRKSIITAENLFHQVRVMISDALQKSEVSKKIVELYESKRLNEIGEKLMYELELDKQMDILHQLVPALGIRSCYVFLFDEKSNPLKSVRLILAFDEKKRTKLKAGGREFLKDDLIPEAVFLKFRRYSYIVEELFNGCNQRGFVLFDIEEHAGEVYEILRNRLSSALEASILIDKIRTQALNLEIEVKERTKELVKINKQLTEEVSEREKVEEKLRVILNDLESSNKVLKGLSIKDELTGLYNRRGFLALGNQHLELAKKMNKNFLLYFIDVDGLKQINDKYGHKEGDEIIIAASRVLKRTFRQTDIIARLGGDEFTALFVDAEQRSQVDIKKRLNIQIEKYNSTSKKPYKLSMSSGVADFKEKKSLSFEELMERADLLLYKNKEKKKKDKKYFNLFH